MFDFTRDDHGLDFALEKHIVKKRVMDIGTLERPYTVVKGKKYLFVERGISTESSECHEVTFLAYAPSAAQIIVGRNGTKMVVDRRRIFLKPDSYHRDPGSVGE